MFTLRFYCAHRVIHVLQAPHYSVSSFDNRKVVTVYPGLTTENGVEYHVVDGEHTQAGPHSHVHAGSCVISDDNGRTVDLVHHDGEYGTVTANSVNPA